MISFLTENIGTILTGLVLLAIVTAIILKIIRDKKKNASVGCTKCAGCPCGCGK